MCKRKRLLMALAALAALGLAVLWLMVVLAEPDHGVTPEIVARIQVGMTPGQVEAILGMRPGFYRPDMIQGPGRQKHEPRLIWAHNDKKIFASETRFWYLEGAAIIVYFDQNESVVHIDAHFQSKGNRMWQRITRFVRLPGEW